MTCTTAPTLMALIRWSYCACWLVVLDQHYQPTRTLRSSDKLLLFVPKIALSAKAFTVSAPSIWNLLSCRSAELLTGAREVRVRVVKIWDWGQKIDTSLTSNRWFLTLTLLLKMDPARLASQHYSDREHSAYSLCHYAPLIRLPATCVTIQFSHKYV